VTQEASSKLGQAGIAITNIQFVVNGFGYGLSQPFLRALVTVDVDKVTDWPAVDHLLRAVMPSGAEPEANLDEEAGRALTRRILHWTRELQRAAGHPIFDPGKVLQHSPDGSAWQLALPAQDHVACIRALRLVCGVIAQGIADPSAINTPFASDRRVDVLTFLKECVARGIRGSNTLHFLEAAHDKRLPWVPLTGTVYQIGTGSRSRWIDSSFTDSTSVIATAIARNKLKTGVVLRRAGIPVPDHALAGSAEDAVRIADQLGYPVVVKPLDKDGGLGVAAGIKDAAGVMRAFEVAQKFSNAILVEKHVEGRDYRLVVFQGKLIWALERVPGGIIGDGVHSVRQLVDKMNADPRRSKSPSAPLKPLDFNDEAIELIREARMNAETVLADGQWLRLRRTANIASGGVPVGVFDRVHPANRLLAERAARALRLDFAGVDLLIPDIERPWTETGAAICEVNAQPTIGTTTSAHLYGQVLDLLFPSGACIPIAAIVGLPARSVVPALVERMLVASGRRVGIASARSVRAAGQMTVTAPANLFKAAQTLLDDVTIDSMLVLIDDDTPLASLLPFDRCSVLALASDKVRGRKEALSDLAQMIIPMSGQLVVDAAAERSLALARDVGGIAVTVSSGEGSASAIPGRDEIRAKWDGKVLTLLENGIAVEIDALEPEGVNCTTGDIALAAAIGAGLGVTVADVHGVLSRIRLGKLTSV
jgi:cyanophycin synthetase